jgi:HSP20 family protein
MSTLRWDPFQDMLSLQDEMNRMFDRAAGRTSPTTGQVTRTWAPLLDIAERKDAYVVTVEVPGVDSEDIDVTLENAMLTIQGERRPAQESLEQQYLRVERAYGTFRRSVSLPSTVQADAIQASYDNGLLQLVSPRPRRPSPGRSPSTPAVSPRRSPPGNGGPRQTPQAALAS